MISRTFVEPENATMWEISAALTRPQRCRFCDGGGGGIESGYVQRPSTAEPIQSNRIVLCSHSFTKGVVSTKAPIIHYSYWIKVALITRVYAQLHFRQNAMNQLHNAI